MNLSRVLFSLLPVLASAASSSLQFITVPSVPAEGEFQPASLAAQGVVPMPGGSVLVFGAVTVSDCTVTLSQSCDQTTSPLLVILDSSGNQLSALPVSTLGSGNSSISSAALDASGNIWIAGLTNSDDFPLVNALYSVKADYGAIGFVAKLDPSLNILFSTFFGSPVAADGPTPLYVALDNSGNAYLSGRTASTSFPATGSVFGTAAPTVNSLGAGYTFVSKISASGSTLVFSRLLGGNGSPCVGGSACIGYEVATTPSAIAVATDGSVVVAGTTNATNFPVTAGAYRSLGGAFVTRIAADGSQMLWSTEVGSVAEAGNYATYSSIQSIAVDSAGNINIAGTAPMSLSPYSNGFAMKLSSDATQLLYVTDLGGSSGATLRGLTLDATGNVWIAGNTNSSNFPGLSNVPASGVDFVLELNANATAFQQIFDFVPATATQPPAFDSSGNILLLAAAGNLLRLNPSTALSAPAVLAVTNSAVPRATAGVAPGELVTIYGIGLGPSTGIVGEPNQNGLYPTQLGGVTVNFGGGSFPSVAAPLLYAGPDQINLQVPFNILDPTTVTITTPTVTLSVEQLQAIGSIGVFGVVNPDGTVNSASNPAPAGSNVSLYVTGLGEPSGAAQNGAISPTATSAFIGHVEVEVEGSLYPLSLLYAGAAPTLINGLDQLVVQLPAVGLPNVVLTVTLLAPYNGDGPATSNAVVVYTHQVTLKSPYGGVNTYATF